MTSAIMSGMPHTTNFHFFKTSVPSYMSICHFGSLASPSFPLVYKDPISFLCRCLVFYFISEPKTKFDTNSVSSLTSPMTLFLANTCCLFFTCDDVVKHICQMYDKQLSTSTLQTDWQVVDNTIRKQEEVHKKNQAHQDAELNKRYRHIFDQEKKSTKSTKSNSQSYFIMYKLRTFIVQKHCKTKFSAFQLHGVSLARKQSATLYSSLGEPFI